MDKWDYFQNGSQDFLFFSISIFIYLSKYETIVRSSVLSFGHSDPDPSSVSRYFFYTPIPSLRNVIDKKVGN